MKIRIELDEKLKEDEVLIRTSRLTDEIAEIQKTIVQTVNNFQKFTFYKGTTEYFLELRDILFFETDEEGICAHTVDDIYQTKYKLYEWEDMLPGFFMRVSKSTILNTDRVYSLTRNLTASSLVTFAGSHKQVYVSRNYYKALVNKIKEKRVHI